MTEQHTPEIEREAVQARVSERVVVRFPEGGPTFATTYGTSSAHGWGEFDPERATTPLRVVEVRVTYVHHFGFLARPEPETTPVVLAVRVRKDGSDGAEVKLDRYSFGRISPDLARFVAATIAEHMPEQRPTILHPRGDLT